MNRYCIFSVILILSLSIIGCGGKKSPDPDQSDTETQPINFPDDFTDTLQIIQTEKFYELEKMWSELIPKEKLII